MMEWIDKVEAKLVRLETWALVLCVVAMLVLAGYNVLYRNALIPLQTYLRSSGPAVTDERTASSGGDDRRTEGGDGETEDPDEGDDGAGGFGGGFGGGQSKGDEKRSDDGTHDDSDGADGFGGGFGGGQSKGDEKRSDDGTNDDSDGADGFGGGFGGGGDSGGDEGKTDDSDGSGGFGGDFGGGASKGDQKESDEAHQDDTDEAGGFGGGFGGGESENGEKAPDGEREASGESRVASRDKPASREAAGGPPPEGSFADGLIEFIDAIKISWIDVLLRQLVLIVGFLGAMLAARQREHITIDAVGQIVTGRRRDALDAATSTFAALVCVGLASSGWSFVALGMEYPRELLPWADQWMLQLMFPIGFGLTGVHFALRALESGVRAARGDASEAESEEEPEASDEAGADETGGQT